MRNIIISLWLTFVLATACSVRGTTKPTPLTSEPVVRWNQLVMETAEAEDGFLTLKGLRTATLMHLAIHDALSNIQPRFQPYRLNHPEPEADPLSALTQAAFALARSQYPDQVQRWSTERERWLADVPQGRARTLGLELGDRAAAAILAARAGDGWDGEAEYRWHPMAPGVYAEFSDHSGTPEGFVFGAGWAEAEPFAINAPASLRVPPPPAIDGPAYAEAFDEVKRVGRDLSDERSPDQTHLALWWKDFAENSHNRLARRLTLERGLTGVTANRLFALLNVAVFDAYVSSFNNKFFYNHWRPYTAIRWAENDGNPATSADPDWNNTHGHTYAFPSYPSAHGTACAAAMSALAETFGDDMAFTMITAEVDMAGPLSGKRPMEPPGRQFNSFSEAAMECALSRVYLGIHFRYDSIEGNRLGHQVGEQVLQTLLLPMSGSDELQGPHKNPGR
ncbi:MAG: vanadium-dependent haloperoxidase [Pseudomonadota bacterium]